MTEPLDRIVHGFQTLTPETVETLGTLYAVQARFKDPFNDVIGLAEIQRIFRHMFVTLESPRFVVTGHMVQGNECFIRWEFRFGFRRFKRGQEQCIVGCSHLVLDDTGRIAVHRDYWDAAEELYEKLPLVGALMRWLKRRSNS